MQRSGIVTRRTWLTRLLVVLAVGLAANSILGPLVFGVIDYRYTDSLVNQGIGLDAVALFGAVPVAIAAAMLVIRCHPAGPVVAFIPATFAAYMAPQYIIGPDYLGLPGNNERFFVFHLTVFVVAVATVIVAWRSVDPDRLRPNTADGDRRRSRVLIGVIAFIVAGRWLTGLVHLLAGDPTSAEFEASPTAYVLIGLLDLGIVVPAAATAAIGLRRHTRWARTAAYAVIGWFALVPAAVAAMAIVMQLGDDPDATTAATVMFTAAAVVFTLGAAALYRPMFYPRSASDASAQHAASVGDSRTHPTTAHATRGAPR